jgi:hypothetical protein
MTTVIKEVKANEIHLSNKNAGISITLEKALKLLPGPWQPTTLMKSTNKNWDNTNPWYDWKVNGCELSLSSKLIYIDGEGNDLFLLLIITENEESKEQYYNIMNGNRY